MVRASLNLSARVAKTSIYYREYAIFADVSNGEVIYGDFNKDAIQSQDVMLYIMRKKLEQTNSFFEREELVKKIRFISLLFSTIILLL